MDNKDIENRFSFHPADSEFKEQAHKIVRNTLKEIALYLNQIIPDSREKGLCITHLEESMYWANAAIARDTNS